MQFGFMSEAETQEGTSYYHRYHELIDEVLLAEQVGPEAQDVAVIVLAGAAGGDFIVHERRAARVV